MQYHTHLFVLLVMSLESIRQTAGMSGSLESISPSGFLNHVTDL